MTSQEKEYYKLREIAEKMYPFLDGLNKHDIDVVISNLRTLVDDSPIIAKLN